LHGTSPSRIEQSITDGTFDETLIEQLLRSRALAALQILIASCRQIGDPYETVGIAIGEIEQIIAGVVNSATCLGVLGADRDGFFISVTVAVVDSLCAFGSGFLAVRGLDALGRLILRGELADAQGTLRVFGMFGAVLGVDGLVRWQDAMGVGWTVVACGVSIAGVALAPQQCASRPTFAVG